MKTLRLVAATALVSSVFALSASAAEKEWWNVDFTSPTPNGVQLNVSELGALTNDASTMAAGTVQPYTNGVWSAVDSDESYVTNEFNPSGSFGGDNCLRLDTQGNDLTWTPEATLVSNNVQTLVDADLYLVGSDSAPTDFDAAGDVQAAIYLKNLTDDESQETTNSILCVYVYNSSIETNVWVELAGVELTDQSWTHIQVKVDHSDDTNPQVSVRVNDTQMYAVGDATATNWPVANGITSGRINSIAFRGTGAVDNFVGKTVAEEEIFCTLTVETWVDNAQNGSAVAKNPTLIQPNVPVGSPYTFPALYIDDYDAGHEATYALSRIVIYNADGTVLETINYSDYDGENIDITPDKDDSAYFAWGLDENDDRDGSFLLTVPTTGIADGDDLVIAKVYYTSFNQPQVVVDPVDPGDSMSAVEKAQYVPAGVVTETDDQTGVTTTSFVVHFKGVAGVTYELLSSTTLTLTDEQWKAATVEDTVVCTSANEDDVLELKVELDPNDTAKFFKIGASATQP